jgi:hypothetical protein
MNSDFFLDNNLESYKTFLDHQWARGIAQQTNGTPLEEIFFDLQWAWKGAANTFFMPWFTVTTMVAAGLGAASDHAFPERYAAAIQDRLSNRMELTNMATKRLRKELQQISEEVRAVNERPPAFDLQLAWQTMLNQSEFRLSIWGSQRLVFAAVYYAYEDFLARCYRLSTGKAEYEVGSKFTQDFRDQYGETLRDFCWCDNKIHVARLTRHALLHNGGRLTSKLKRINNHGLMLRGEDIQVFPAVTRGLYELLRDRVTKFLGDPDGPLAKLAN